MTSNFAPGGGDPRPAEPAVTPTLNLQRELHPLRCEHWASRAVFTPLRPPWIVVHQHDYEAIKAVESSRRWDDAHFIASREGKLVTELDLKAGYIAFQKSSDGGVERAAYYVDSGG